MLHMTFEGSVTRKPEPVGVAAGEWTHSLDMMVQTGMRGGRPYFEHFYVLAREKDVLALPPFEDGEVMATVTVGAVWTALVADWAGQQRPCFCCTASTLTVRARKSAS